MNLRFLAGVGRRKPSIDMQKSLEVGVGPEYPEFHWDLLSLRFL